MDEHGGKNVCQGKVSWNEAIGVDELPGEAGIGEAQPCLVQEDQDIERNEEVIYIGNQDSRVIVAVREKHQSMVNWIVRVAELPALSLTVAVMVWTPEDKGSTRL